MAAQSTGTIAGITIPDTPLVRDVTTLIRAAEEDLLFDHSRRVFLFGALQGRRRGLQPDLELLYVGAMFHDIGLTQRYRTSSLRFEVDSANAARDFLLDHGVDEAAARNGVAFHRAAHHPGGARIPRPRDRAGHRRRRNRRAGHRTRRACPRKRSPPSPPRIRDPISKTVSCRPLRTAWRTGRAAPSAPSTPTCWNTSTTPSSETTSWKSSATTPGPNSSLH